MAGIVLAGRVKKIERVNASCSQEPTEHAEVELWIHAWIVSVPHDVDGDQVKVAQRAET
jgi:hypothetical protein